MKTNNLININPASKKVSALNKAYKTFRDEIDRYANQNQISDKELRIIKEALDKVYQNKKMTYFLEEKTGHFNKYIEDAFNSALGNIENPESNKEPVDMDFFDKQSSSAERQSTSHKATDLKPGNKKHSYFCSA
ncbi:hypothetical protein [Anaerophaga thermohalophila]|uniref:hypothetical protein n=1 Tax=Anaerophaga thermohalophila TaxID=177400 RepID=UPI000237D3A5|nr:hypothetical protein [Anaerophaga thermohalophila]